MPGGGLARVAVPRARMSVARPIRGGPAPAATAKASSGGAWLKNLWQKRIKRNMSRALAAVNSRAGGPQDTRDGGAPRASPLPVGVVPPAPRTGVKRGTHPKLPQARRGRLTLKAASHTKAAETLPDGMGVPAGAGPGPGPRDQPRRCIKRSRATEFETHAERKRAKAGAEVRRLQLQRRLHVGRCAASRRQRRRHRRAGRALPCRAPQSQECCGCAGPGSGLKPTPACLQLPRRCRQPRRREHQHCQDPLFDCELVRSSLHWLERKLGHPAPESGSLLSGQQQLVLASANSLILFPLALNVPHSSKTRMTREVRW